jgi:hypothetical protein
MRPLLGYYALLVKIALCLHGFPWRSSEPDPVISTSGNIAAAIASKVYIVSSHCRRSTAAEPEADVISTIG